MKTVLIIDDDLGVQNALSRVLQRAGYSVIAAPDGNVGFDLFERLNPDLVITDILMPEREGIETISAIRRHRPDARIIAMSGGAGQLNAEYLLRVAGGMGAVASLAKPFEPRELLAKVEECLLPSAPAERMPASYVADHAAAVC